MKIGSLLLALVILLVAATTSLAHAGQVNWFSLSVLHACLTDEKAKIFEASSPPGRLTSRMAHLKAIQARCAADTSMELSAWEDMLAISAERVPVFRSLYRTDESLARLAAQLQPGSAQAWIWLGDILYDKKDAKGAAQAYHQGLALAPGDGLAWRKLGDMYRTQENWQAAALAYDQACMRAEQGRNGCLRAGGSYLMLGDYETAAHRYRMAIRQLPFYWPARTGLARALIAMQQVEEALPYLEAAARGGDHEAVQLLQELAQAGNAKAQDLLDHLQLTPTP